MSYDAFYEKLEENTFVAFIMKHPVVCQTDLSDRSQIQ